MPLMQETVDSVPRHPSAFLIRKYSRARQASAGIEIPSFLVLRDLEFRDRTIVCSYKNLFFAIVLHT